MGVAEFRKKSCSIIYPDGPCSGAASLILELFSFEIRRKSHACSFHALPVDINPGSTDCWHTDAVFLLIQGNSLRSWMVAGSALGRDIPLFIVVCPPDEVPDIQLSAPSRCIGVGSLEQEAGELSNAIAVFLDDAFPPRPLAAKLRRGEGNPHPLLDVPMAFYEVKRYGS